jgi:Tfp pilus assembly protein PilN
MVSFHRSGSTATDQSDSEAVNLAVPSAARSAAAFPRVNLMPDVVAAEARVHRARMVLVGATVASLAVVGSLYALGAGAVSSAQDQLDAATAQGASLAAEAAKYADVPKVQAQVTAARTQQYQALGGEARWSFLLNNLALTIPVGTSLTSFTGTITGVPPAPAGASASSQAGAAAASPVGAPPAGTVVSVLGHPGIGTITYVGEALGYPQVANFLDAQAKQKTLIDPFASAVNANTATGGKGLTFTSTATITAAALSHRYDVKAGS